MWSKPWSYKEGLVIGAGLLVIGILLQMAAGWISEHIFHNKREIGRAHV